MKVAARFNIDGFKASNGWIEKFRRRHGISYSTTSGECSAVDQNIIEHWKSESPKKTEGYEDRDIFNADETGLFFNLLPDKTLNFSGQPCHGGKYSKERLTVLLCANKDGSIKVVPLVIGKSAKPRCFKNVKTLPTQYESNTSAWMTSFLFMKFLRWFDAFIGNKRR